MSSAQSGPAEPAPADFAYQHIDAITLATHHMRESVEFYSSLGLRLIFGGADADISTFSFGEHSNINIVLTSPEARWSWWGRVIIYVSDVDALYRRVLACGYHPVAPPRDAEWGERYFQVRDPAGHELSFAKRLS